VVAPEDAEMPLADYFVEESRRRPKQGDVVQLGPIALVAHRVASGRVTSVGLRLAEDDTLPATISGRIKKLARDLWKRFG
jgi:NhaP-type Na+/H+ and K+/H+ antiporter